MGGSFNGPSEVLLPQEKGTFSKYEQLFGFANVLLMRSQRLCGGLHGLSGMSRLFLRQKQYITVARLDHDVFESPRHRANPAITG